MPGGPCINKHPYVSSVTSPLDITTNESILLYMHLHFMYLWQMPAGIGRDALISTADRESQLLLTENDITENTRVQDQGNN